MWLIHLFQWTSIVKENLACVHVNKGTFIARVQVNKGTLFARVHVDDKTFIACVKVNKKHYTCLSNQYLLICFRRCINFLLFS